MLVGDLLLARRMLWISIMRSEPSEKGGDRDSDLSAGSEACTALSINSPNGLGHPGAAPGSTWRFLGPRDGSFSPVRGKVAIPRQQGVIVDPSISLLPVKSEGARRQQVLLSRPGSTLSWLLCNQVTQG